MIQVFRQPSGQGLIVVLAFLMLRAHAWRQCRIVFFQLSTSVLATEVNLLPRCLNSRSWSIFPRLHTATINKRLKNGILDSRFGFNSFFLTEFTCMGRNSRVKGVFLLEPIQNGFEAFKILTNILIQCLGWLAQLWFFVNMNDPKKSQKFLPGSVRSGFAQKARSLVIDLFGRLKPQWKMQD